MTHQRVVLPDPVRARVISLAAQALGTMSGDEAPPALRPVVRFADAQRAKRGASAIAAALETHAGFRARVLAMADGAYPGLVAALRDGTAPAAADPVDVAVVAYLQRADGWEKVVDAAGVTTENVGDLARSESDLIRLREQLDDLRAESKARRDKHKAELERVKDENRALRQRLNSTRTQLARAQEDLAELEQQVHAGASTQADTEREVRRLRGLVADAEEERDAARRAGRNGRDLETAKISLLIDTLAEAAVGLRRELALAPTERRPADDVVARSPGTDTVPAHGRARSSNDRQYLVDLLGMPKAHLVVDGYNVTKSIWGDLPLEAQRSRLVSGLRALAARTSAETTCVFDGADVAAPPPMAPTAGVRVRFSAPGETADELIRRLVSAEPAGRVVVVVSSDREVADGVQRRGGHAVGAIALASLLE